MPRTRRTNVEEYGDLVRRRRAIEREREKILAKAQPTFTANETIPRYLTQAQNVRLAEIAAEIQRLVLLMSENVLHFSTVTDEQRKHGPTLAQEREIAAQIRGRLGIKPPTNALAKLKSAKCCAELSQARAGELYEAREDIEICPRHKSKNKRHCCYRYRSR